MAILSKGTTFLSGQSVTANSLNALVDSAAFNGANGGAADGTTIQVHGSGYLEIKDGGITNAKLAAGAVNASTIGSGTITDTQLADNSVTAVKISATDTTFNVGTNVGIGAVASGTYKLEVAGDIAAAGAGVKKVISHSSDSVAYLEMYSGGQATNKKTGRLVPFDGKLQLAWVNDDASAGVVVQLDQVTGGFEPNADNAQPLGSASKRWSVVYSVTATINTSDRNLKEEIEELSDAELRVAQACKGLVRRFKFKGGTRKHIGVIAQDVRDAFSVEGLDAHEYGLFCSDTWTDEDTGEEVTQLGIRYEELLAFIITAL